MIISRTFIHCEHVLHGFPMQIQPFFHPKKSAKSFFSYEGASKDPLTGSAKATVKQPSEPEEYPMGEWNPSEPEDYPMGEWTPSSESSSTAETVLAAIGQGTIVDPNASPSSSELVTTFFPMGEW